jgi:3-isopropylmalate/(R)-2-methylmalate dehydratase large subunit
MVASFPGSVNNEASKPRTMFEKIWSSHAVLEQEDGNTLLYVDRQLIHEGSFHAFEKLRDLGMKVARPEYTLAVADHYVPTDAKNVDDVRTPEIRHMIELLSSNAKTFGVQSIELGDIRRGIVHVIGPELGYTLPGSVLVCGDSHTSTHGALGAFAFGIGNSEVAHVMATQTVWQRRPHTMRIRVNGQLHEWVSAKDVILAIIAEIGTSGAVGHVIEYAGDVIRNLDISGRLTICNMSIEAGARAGMVAPDETTFTYLRDRPLAPKGEDFERALHAWRMLPTDEGARFDNEVTIDGNIIEPMITWGITPEMSGSIGGEVPHAQSAPSEEAEKQLIEALDYMGLTPGTRFVDIAVDQVFIGSCTNSRIEDLRIAATIARKGHAKVPTLVSPGSGLVKQQAEQEGLDVIFRDAGFVWGEASCSMCLGINGDTVGSGKRCISTSNRNFRGRQGQGARTHLASPAMAAAAALTGRLTDVREFQL